MTSWNLNCSLAEFIAEEAEVPVDKAARVAELFEDGNEIAYVARYRVDAHGGMSCDQVRRVYEVLKEAKELNKKVERAIVTVEAKAGDDAPYAVQKLKESRIPEDVSEVTKMYTSGRKTKVSVARGLGLEDAAVKIISGQIINLRSLVKRSDPELASFEKVEEHLNILLADLINKDPEVVEMAKNLSRLESQVEAKIKADLSAKAKKWKEGDKEYGLIREFQECFTTNSFARNIQNHQILRLNRGEEKEVLVWSVEFGGVEHIHPGNRKRVAAPHIDIFRKALSYSITKLFIPKIQRATKRFLSNRAELGAIECFAKNLSQLFAQEGIKEKHVAALDPGFSACKGAFLSPDGSVIETKQLSFRNCFFDRNGEEILKGWARIAGSEMIVAVGNGTASFETQKALQDLISRKTFGVTKVQFCVVDECGASKYSITELAEQELPGVPVTEKSAVSIGRRLIDPVSEFVKIEPRHLGIGMYQHSVNQKKLTETLDLVVRDSVSIRGVDVNVASLQLLQQVCGLNKKTAAGIIALRKKKGRISSRDELKKVTGLGPKSFQQAAGFLRVTAPENASEPLKKKKKTLETDPLDATIVHPDHYDIARALLKKAGVSTEEIGTKRANERLMAVKAQSEEESLVLDLMTSTPKIVPPPVFVSEVRKVGSLREGEKLMGRVTNVTDFGAFIDIGAEKSALAHKSCFKPRGSFPEVGSRISVVVVSVDENRGRIAVRPIS